MARHTFHGQVAHEAGTQSTDGIIKSQFDLGIADAKNRANHTGQQPASTITDLTEAIDARISTVVDGAPTALDTLNELAAALGDNPNFSATVTTQLGDLDARIDTLEAGTSAGGYKTSVGDGVDSVHTVTHDLGTTDVMVEVVLLSSGQTVFPVVTRTTINAVTVDFGTTVPGLNSHRVLVRAV